MNRIKRHIPGFVYHEPEDLVEIDFDSLEELLAIDWVRRWKEYGGLHRYSVSRTDRHTLLMAECDDGTFWVVGYLKEDVPELPSWSKEECDQRKAGYDAR